MLPCGIAMSVPIPRGKPAASAPIPIASRKPVSRAGQGLHYLSASVPAAPIIGSLKAPTALETMIPDLVLPPSTPEALSLAAIHSEPLSSARMVGVSSAPARAFIEHAHRSGASVPLGVSPTVLSILSSHGKDDSLPRAKHMVAPPPGHCLPLTSFTKVAPTTGAHLPPPGESGLSSVLKRGGPPPAHPGQPAVFSTHAGAPILLSASFRDPSHMPIPLEHLREVEEDDNSDLDSSDDGMPSGGKGKKLSAAAGGLGSGKKQAPKRRGDVSDDEEEHKSGSRPERAPSDRDEGGIFDAEF